MALNKYMHERNVYKERKPDFQALAVKYDYFREKVTQTSSGKMILDFKDPASMRALTRALLEEDFGLSVELPLDRLIPMVPQRLNYILWLEDILGTSDHQVRGIDIGTGASCVFPLLGCRQNGWTFLASELDDQNVHFATKNVEKNKMQDKITIKKVSEDIILRGFVDEEGSYDFCMCNPPFYSDHLEAQGITSTRSDDRPEPNSTSTANETESIAWGGEVRFVSRMIEESLVLKGKIRVYTSMLGKKMSVSLLKDELVQKKIPKFSTTEFCQGKTMRWGIAWTFDETVNFPKSAFKSLKNVKPPLVYEVPRSSRMVRDYTVQAFTHVIKQELDTLKIHFYVKHSGKFYTGLLLKATENNWSNQRRKRRQQKRQSESESDQPAANTKTDSGEDKCPDTAEAAVTSSDTQDVDKSPAGVDKDAENTNTNSEKVENVSEPRTDPNTSTNGNTLSENTKTESKTLSNVSDPKNDFKQSANGNAKATSKELQTPQNDVKDNTSEESSLEVGCKTDSVATKGSLIAGDTVSKTAESMDTETHEADLSDKTAIKKRTIDETSHDPDNEQNGKRFKTDTDSEIRPSETKTMPKAKSDTNCEEMDLEAAWIKASTVPPEADEKTEASAAVMNRAEIVKRFWKEQESNSGKKPEPKSPYQSQEPFREDAECLLLCKLELKKEEGVIRLVMTHVSGQKEAMAQIQQYFKNKIATGVCEYGAG